MKSLCLLLLGRGFLLKNIEVSLLSEEQTAFPRRLFFFLKKNIFGEPF